MAKEFLDYNGLVTFLDQSKNTFVTEEDVSLIEKQADDYILKIDYSVLEFDTSEIVD